MLPLAKLKQRKRHQLWYRIPHFWKPLELHIGLFISNKTKDKKGNRLRDFLKINQQKWISRSNNGTMQWWTIFLKLDWQEFYILTSSNNSVTNTAESVSNVSMVLHWKRNVVIAKRKEYSQDVLSHVRGLSSLTLLVTFNSLLTPKSATFRCPVSSLKIFLLCHVKILKH